MTEFDERKVQWLRVKGDKKERSGRTKKKERQTIMFKNRLEKVTEVEME